MLAYTLTINGVDFTDAIRFDSYSTKKIPVYSQSVQTLDGVTHVALLRNKGQVTFTLNPKNAEDTETLVDALLAIPCTVYYFNLQTQLYETANMTLDEVSADFLARCKFLGKKWSQTDQITLEEL